jgi:acyl-coenzyme A synthetase/AMP-(fatty) acid ligase
VTGTFHLTTAELAAHGDAVALASQAGSLTYAELASRAKSLGRALRKHGIPPGAAVALVSSGRGFDEAVALCGILASGCIAVPLDSAAPPQRLASIVHGRGCRALVCDEGAAALAASVDEALGSDGPVLRDVRQSLPRVVLDGEGHVSNPAAPSAPGEEAVLRDVSVACILHTSGSTGTPKPVPITWEGLDAFTAFWAEKVDLKPGDRVLRVAELVFDLAWFDHLATFRRGATLVTMRRRDLAVGRALKDAVKALRPTIIYGVPSLFIKLAAALGEDEKLDSALRTVMFAGEVFPPKELHAFAAKVPGAELYNLYGPTETNVCTYHHLRRKDVDGIREVPIGVACPYSPCELVAEDGSLVAGAGIGELFVSGVTTVGGGPFPTRDRVERGEDGLFYFRGRIDRMVKIRGYRVEPGEVEAALHKHPAVEQAAVLPVDDPKLGKVLHAHVAKKQVIPPPTTTDRDLRMYLATVLPPYMVPEKIALVDDLPRTTTGKIDYQALGAKAGS